MLTTDIEVIRNGGLVIFPTETIYGLGCRASDEAAVSRVFALKGRAPDKPPPILVADESQLATLVEAVPDIARRLMEQFWPGSLTIVMAARAEVSPLLTITVGHLRTIAVRQSGHPLARELCEAVGAPIVATSANYSGATGAAATPHVLNDIPEAFRRSVDVVIDGGGVAGQPSTIVDCTGPVLRVLRQGAVVLSEEWLSP